MLESSAMRRAPFNPRLAGLMVAALGALYAWPLIAFGLTGSLTRYMADDFCVVALARSQNLLQTVVSQYLTWSGRYSYLLLSALAGWLGPGLTPILPAALILLWLAALAWSLTQLPFASPNAPRSSVVLAILIVAATLSATPNVVQSLYWQTARSRIPLR